MAIRIRLVETLLPKRSEGISRTLRSKHGCTVVSKATNVENNTSNNPWGVSLEAISFDPKNWHYDTKLDPDASPSKGKHPETNGRLNTQWAWTVYRNYVRIGSATHVVSMRILLEQLKTARYYLQTDGRRNCSWTSHGSRRRRYGFILWESDWRM